MEVDATSVGVEMSFTMFFQGSLPDSATRGLSDEIPLGFSEARHGWAARFYKYISPPTGCCADVRIRAPKEWRSDSPHVCGPPAQAALGSGTIFALRVGRLYSDFFLSPRDLISSESSPYCAFTWIFVPRTRL